jgi:hypothetical protein
LNSDLHTLLEKGTSWLHLGHAVTILQALETINQTLLRIEKLLAGSNAEGNKIVASIQDLQNAVAQQTSVEQSVLALISGLRDQLAQAVQNNDPNAIQQVLDQLNANTQALSAAVVANTPAADGGGGAGGATGGGGAGGATGATGEPGGGDTGATGPTG